MLCAVGEETIFTPPNLSPKSPRRLGIPRDWQRLMTSAAPVNGYKVISQSRPGFSLAMEGQYGDEERDIKKVHSAVLIEICFQLELVRGKHRDERKYVRKVDQAIEVDVTK